MLLGLGALVLGGIIWLNSLFSSPELPEHYDFHNDDIGAARRQAAPQLEAELEALERRAAIVPVGPAGRSDRCRPGNDSYKAPSQYAYSCRMELVRLFPIGEPSKVEASRLGEALIEGDCPAGTDTDIKLAEHFFLEDMPETSGDCTQGSQLGTAPVISGWLPVKPSRDELTAASNQLPEPCAAISAYCEETRLHLGAAASAAPRGTTYLGLVVAHRDYYDVPW